VAAPPLDVSEFSASVLDAVERAGLGLTIVQITDGHLERIYSNPEMCRMTGYTVEELRGIAPTDLVPSAERARLIAMRATFVADGSFPHSMESVLLARDGTEIPVELSLANVPYRDGSATVTFIRDIRERHRAATALRESEARFRSLAEASADSITVIAGRRFAYANPAAAHVLGFDSPEELMTRPLDQLLVDDGETREMMQRVQRILRGEHVGPREYRGRRKDGSVAVMEISSTAITYDGQAAVLAFGRDTTERRAWQAELLRNDRLAAIGLLAASVAHEINNPLTYLMLHVDRLADLVPAAVADEATRKRVAETIAAIRDGGTRVRTIVRELLSVARHDDDATPVSVSEVLDTAVRLAGPTLRERAELLRKSGDVPPVVANAGRLSQVFVNLLLNAADAFDTPSPANRIEISIAADGDHVVVAVVDNGRGIAPDDLDRIFEPMFTTKPRGTSTGLGLAICRAIVAEIGGSLAATAPDGRGTRMEVRLPAHDRVAARRGRHEPVTRQRRRIAVIDDDALVARSLAALIGREHQVETFTSPRAALAALSDAEAFDHVLCDVNMPGLSGPDLYEQLCVRRPEYARRFTLITGGAASPKIDALVETHQVTLLRKPCDAQTILDAVARDGA
jgi:PAS domain S-box-containing protein